MTDAEYEAQKARVQALIDKWLDPLYLLWWHIDVAWHRQKNCESPDDAFGVNVRWRYCDATINVYLPNLDEFSDEYLEMIFIHECMHIIVNELRPLADADKFPNDWQEHEERTCTMLARAFQCVRDFAKEGKL